MERNPELIVALVVVLLLTILYIPLASLESLRPGGLGGHSIGIVGFLLMLATETLYSLRKHSQRMVRWGSMRTWLSVHIVMGIVGPYMVFLHTGFQFAGLAGITLVLTAVVVESGFVGRYIYTAVPHTATGALVEAPQLETAMRQADARLQAWLATRSARLQALAAQMDARPATTGQGVWAVLGRTLIQWDDKRRWRREVARLDRATRQQAAELPQLIRRRQTLQRQMAALEAARGLIALWYIIHVPLGIALFAAAFLHIVGAMYYS